MGGLLIREEESGEDKDGVLVRLSEIGNGTCLFIYIVISLLRINK